VTTRRDFVLGASGMAAMAIAGPHRELAAAQPVRGGSLAAAMVLEPASLDPIFGNAGGSDSNVYNLFAERLVYQDDTGKVLPALAESWDLAQDGMSYRFKLRSNVRFQDGTPFDAAAVKVNLERAADPVVNSRARAFLTDLASVEVVDPLTAAVKLKRPSGPFLSVLGGPAGTMMSPTALRERGAEFARSPVGTGPFVITGWAAGKVDSKRFDGYWGRAPYLDTVAVRTIANTAVKLVELKSGNVQLGDIVQVKDMEEIEADPNLRLIDTIQVITSYLSFNNQAAPFKGNQLLRQAVAHAINRAAIEKAISRGQGGVLAALEPPQSQAFGKELVPHAFDPELARKEYSQSGHKGPLTLVVIQRDPDTQIAQIIQSMCKVAGIDLRIQVLERLAWVEKVLRYDYELGILRSSSPTPDPDITFSQFYGRAANSDYSGIKDPEIWGMIDKGRALSDMEERRKIYVAIQKTIADNYWQTYFFWRPQKDVARKELQGFTREYNGAWRYHDMWLAKS